MATATTRINPSTDLGLLRLLQLVSPALPVGAYAFSQGLELAVEAGWVGNARQTREWIGGILTYSQARLDVPVLVRFYQAWQRGDLDCFQRWNRFLAAARGSAELQQEDCHMGWALYRLLGDLGLDEISDLPCSDPSFTAMFAVAACRWEIALETAATGLCWSWAENQVAAAVKLVPLGQTQGQKILLQIAEEIPAAVATGMALRSEEIGAVSPAVAMASARHETQHTRLFRS